MSQHFVNLSVLVASGIFDYLTYRNQRSWQEKIAEKMTMWCMVHLHCSPLFIQDRGARPPAPD